jgi:hypothetical protein
MGLKRRRDMYTSLRELFGAEILATDGSIGKVHDFYFDDRDWTVRYLIADTGGWLSGRLVLVSPAAFGEVGRDGDGFPVNLTKQQIEDGPSIDQDKPVNRQHEEALAAHYNWPTYWLGGLGAPVALGLYPEAATMEHPGGAYPGQDPASEAEHETRIEQESGDRHLRSVRDVTGYEIGAADAPVGQVEDFLADPGWVIRFLRVDTHRWLPAKDVLLAVDWITEVSWQDSRVYVNLSKDDIESAPEYKKGDDITPEFEERLCAHYRRPHWNKVRTRS